MRSKIVIIGAGNVGTTIAFTLLLRGSVREVHIIDLDKSKLHGEVLDLNHGRPFVPACEIFEKDYTTCKDADIIIITAGAKQKPNESRIDLVNRNILVLKAIITSIKQNIGHNQPILLVVSNPLDILTYFAYQFSGLPRAKVFGSGTVLDSARLRFEISQHCHIDSKNIHGYVVGEHGDSEVVLWSSLRIGLMLFSDFCKTCKSCKGINEDSEGIKTEIDKNVRNAAYEIINSKGYTNFGIGVAVVRIIEAIVSDQNSIIPVSSILEGEYDEKNVAMSIPCVVNAQGIHSLLEQNMTIEEKDNFHKSAEKLRGIINQIT